MNKQQLFFSFQDTAKSYLFSDIIVGPFNLDVINFFFKKKTSWLTDVVVLFGNHGVGKTMIVSVFLNDKSFVKIDAKNISQVDIDSIINNYDYIFLEDLEQLLLEDQEKLFDLYNEVVLFNKKMIITSSEDSDYNHITLPDLKSRLQFATPLIIKEPNDDYLKIIFYKQISDKQLLISDDVINYIVKRIPRQISAINEVIAKIEYFVMTNKKKITLSNIGKIINL